MNGLRFLDFDLAFRRSATGYQARVLGSPAGQADADFVLPFSPLEIENFVLRCGRPSQALRGLATSQIEVARAFGARLFEAAFQGEVRSCLRSSLDEARRMEAGLRIRLRLTEAPELNDLPWEFLVHPTLGRFFALSADTPLVRYLDLPERVRPLAVRPPLEVLAVLCSPRDHPRLRVEEEWQKLNAALERLQARGVLNLRRLDQPTLPHLQRWLRRHTCHVLHFIGHGGFDPRTEDGLLLFADERGRGREVGGRALGTLLHDHRPLRLAVLNACEGARSSRTEPFAGVAQSLVREGIPAVVAMQFEITDRAAIELSYELYAAVVDGYPIDAALGEARKALFFAGHELEWGTPVLYMRSADGQLFDLGPAAQVESPPAPAEYRTVRLERAALLRQIEAERAASPPADAVPEATEPSLGGLSPPEAASPAEEPVAPPSAATQEGLDRRRRSLPLLAALVLVAIVGPIAAGLYVGSGARPVEQRTQLGDRPRRESEDRLGAREAGVYLKVAVRAGEPIRQPMIEAVSGASPAADRPLALSDVVNGCFAADFAAGHRLVWSDIGKCQRSP